MVYQQNSDGNYAPQGQGNFSGQGGSFGGGRGFAPRQMVDVTGMGLKCASCGVDITELPFQPSTDRPVYCKDCNRQRRQNFRGGNGGGSGGGRNY